MELQKITRQNIVTTTGQSMEDLLGTPPVRNVLLNKLKRPRSSQDIDLLVRGNPQLTLGLVTPIEVVDAYFDCKSQERKLRSNNGD